MTSKTYKGESNVVRWSACDAVLLDPMIERGFRFKSTKTHGEASYALMSGLSQKRSSRLLSSVSQLKCHNRIFRIFTVERVIRKIYA